MIGVDTNILLRYVVKDDDVQFAKSAAFFGERSPADPAFVSMLVLAETAWTLKYRYGYSNDAVKRLIGNLLQARELSVEGEEFLSVTFSSENNPKADVADYLISFAAMRSGCGRTVTFDTRAATHVPGMELLT